MQVHVSSSDHEGVLSEWNVHVLRRNSGTWFKVKELVCYLVTGDCRSIAIFSHKSQFSVDRDHRPAKTKKQLIIVFRNLALENFFSQVESQKNGYVNIPFAFGLTHILFCWLGFLSSKSDWFDWQIQRAADIFTYYISCELCRSMSSARTCLSSLPINPHMAPNWQIGGERKNGSMEFSESPQINFDVIDHLGYDLWVDWLWRLRSSATGLLNQPQ